MKKSRSYQVSITEKENPFINGIKLPDYIDSVLEVSLNSIPVKYSFSVNSKQLFILFTGKNIQPLLRSRPSIFNIDIKYFSKSLDRDDKLNSLGI